MTTPGPVHLRGTPDPDPAAVRPTRAATPSTPGPAVHSHQDGTWSVGPGCRTLFEHQFEEGGLAAAQQSGELALVDVGAETHLSGHTDAVTGGWLREVLQAKAEADRGLTDDRTPGGRLLAALLDLVRGARRSGTRTGTASRCWSS